ncbi:group III truncated hemoglobin [Rhodobacteraceae bacterium LMO-12]|nr:group III truncated hemoglobin [Rhodobacteraceae bacterium LMO-JJ12]
MNDMIIGAYDCSERKRAQFRQVAEIIGIDKTYLDRMLNFFGARVCFDRQLGRFCTEETGCDKARQMERMTVFWRMIALYEEGYSGNLVQVHRDLPDIRRQDFARWLELFRETLDETAPTPEAANYLMARATRVAHGLEKAVFERKADDISVLHEKVITDKRS